MRITNNIPALAALGALARTDAANQKASLRLSSGNKLNSAADDAAGMAISNKLRNQLRGLERANLNSSNGISIAQTADGSLGQIQAAMQRIRELAVQASNDTNETEDKGKMQAEINQLLDEVNAMANKCEYNKMKLLRGGEDDNTVPNAAPNTATADTSQKVAAGAQNSNDLILKIQVGGNQDVNMSIILPRIDTEQIGEVKTMVPQDMYGNPLIDETTAPPTTIPQTEYLFHLEDVDVTQQAPFPATDADGNPILDADGEPVYKSGSQQAINIMEEALADISDARARVGAYQNRLQYTVENLANSGVNAAESLSRIADTDMAAESTEYAKTNVMIQAATSVLAQANQRPQMILQLIK